MADAVAEYYDPFTGRLQASAGMAGFVCRRSGTGQTQTRMGGNTNRSSLLVDASGCQVPVIVLRLDDYGAALYGFSGSSVHFVSSAPVGTPFTYYVFDYTLGLPDVGSLFRLQTADGRATFDSSFWPLKIVGFLNGGAGGGMSATPGTVIGFACNTIGGHSRLDSVACYDSGSPEFLDGPCRDVRGYIDGKLYGGQTSGGGTQVEAVQVSHDDVQASLGSDQDYARGFRQWETPNLIMIADVTNIPIGNVFF
jgi:hypothetical protein